jgi:hypothetical protein
MGELFNPMGGSGSFTILQDTPVLTSDAQGVYALSYLLPANSLTNEGGILVITSNANYAFGASANSADFGVVMYNSGDTYKAGNLVSLIMPTVAFDAHTYINASAYLDGSGNLVFLETVTQFNSESTPYQSGGAGNGGGQVSTPPNVSGSLNFAEAVTVQLVFSDTGTVTPTKSITYLGGYTRLILVTA